MERPHDEAEWESYGAFLDSLCLSGIATGWRRVGESQAIDLTPEGEDLVRRVAKVIATFDAEQFAKGGLQHRETARSHRAMRWLGVLAFLRHAGKSADEI